ncbi:muscle M-line assembly protein unc-89-like [Leguminivora glycinivorella]|uniref:muscle M-line assembly protein unc-89-like n=1 Tax=Leguminivora glycinivorella TaxID=1035111 RepID=UPI00200CFE63|nr:muscle M-line assembly protein unc-89-like [Leguminivora glycinivorella]
MGGARGTCQLAPGLRGEGARVDEADHSVDQPADPSPVQQKTDPPQTPDPKETTPQPEEKPETKSNTPERENPTTEKKATTPEPVKTSEQRKTPEPEVLDAKAQEEQIMPPEVNASPKQTRKKFKINTNKNEFEGMSPASRFIAMRRMGMFSDHEDSSKENTPKRPAKESDPALQDAAQIRTPTMEEVMSSPNLNALSPNTRRKLQAIKRGEMPDSPIRTPKNPFEIPTPDSGFGAILRPGVNRMSTDSRKRLWQFVHSLPTNETVGATESQPSKIAKLTEDHCAGGAKPSEMPRTPLSSKPPGSPRVVPVEVDEQLQRLAAALTGRRTPRRASRPPAPHENQADMDYESGPESQPNTVGWDDTTPSQKDSFESNKPHTSVTAIDKTDTSKSNIELENADSKNENQKDSSKIDVDVSNSVLKVDKGVEAKVVKRFMLSSNVDNREETVEMIIRLGGSVTDLDDDDSGPPATHLLCCAPARSQRVLNCIASGCWVLHPAYVARSAALGTFLPEENFEWGNPLATCLPPVTGGERVLALAAHRWRTRRARGQPGPFAGVIALLHAPEQRRKLLARLVKAGEGTVVDEEPPYTDETINVCFADPKRYPMKERDRAWLVSRRVPVCASILLSAFITEESRPDLNQHCLPEFRP